MIDFYLCIYLTNAAKRDVDKGNNEKKKIDCRLLAKINEGNRRMSAFI